jgi:hypothetical protein
MRAYYQVSGTLFALIALVHVLRVVQSWPIDVAGWVMPMWVSVAAALVTGALAIWAFRAGRQAK